MSKIPKLPHFMDQPIHFKCRDSKEKRKYAENWGRVFGKKPKPGSPEWQKANPGLVVVEQELGYCKIGINPNYKKNRDMLK